MSNNSIELFLESENSTLGEFRIFTQIQQCEEVLNFVLAVEKLSKITSEKVSNFTRLCRIAWKTFSTFLFDTSIFNFVHLLVVPKADFKNIHGLNRITNFLNYIP